jgi:hypothetical protein
LVVIRSRQRHLVGCAWFWAWAVVGAGIALTFVSFIGTLTALPIALAVLLMARSRKIRESAFGAVSGAGLLLLYIGWIHRAGEDRDPRPWLALGSALLLAGIVGHALREARRAE